VAPLNESQSTVRAAREQYFRVLGVANGGYDDRWVHVRVGPAGFCFPNTRGRVRAVKLHDLHHILTEYETTWTGEAQIAAWEIASNCRRYYIGWLLNFGALAIGILIAPRLVYRAFVRGRHTRNLYAGEFNESLLDRKVGDLRAELGLS
jgi:hypothetical protein